MKIPGVCILPGDELYAEFGWNYLLDRLSALSVYARRAYNYTPTELTKAVFNPDGSRPSPMPFHTAIPLSSQVAGRPITLAAPSG